MFVSKSHTLFSKPGHLVNLVECFTIITYNLFIPRNLYHFERVIFIFSRIQRIGHHLVEVKFDQVLNARFIYACDPGPFGFCFKEVIDTRKLVMPRSNWFFRNFWSEVKTIDWCSSRFIMSVTPEVLVASGWKSLSIFGD